MNRLDPGERSVRLGEWKGEWTAEWPGEWKDEWKDEWIGRTVRAVA